MIWFASCLPEFITKSSGSTHTEIFLLQTTSQQLEWTDNNIHFHIIYSSYIDSKAKEITSETFCRLSLWSAGILLKSVLLASVITYTIHSNGTNAVTDGSSPNQRLEISAIHSDETLWRSHLYLDQAQISGKASKAMVLRQQRVEGKQPKLCWYCNV